MICPLKDLDELSFYKQIIKIILEKMKGSRSGSKDSFTSSTPKKHADFRTVHRNRSNHEMAELDKPKIQVASSRAMPTESRLERMLNLSPQLRPSVDVPRSVLASRWRSSFKEESQLQKRRLIMESGSALKDNRSIDRLLDSQRLKQTHVQLFEQSPQQLSSAQQQPYFSSSSSRFRQSPQKSALSRFQTPSKELDFFQLQTTLNQLMNKKLSLMQEHFSSPKAHSNLGRSVFTFKAESVDNEIQQLLQRIAGVREDGEGQTRRDEIVNKKIEYLEIMMAEAMTEAELMKKSYLANLANKKCCTVSLSTNVSKDKMMKAVRTFNEFQKERRTSMKQMQSSPNKRLKMIDPLTTNRDSFRLPNPEDYKCYKYQPKQACPNHQPLPRSSYRRDYLELKTEPSEKIVLRGNSEVFPRYSYDISSLYAKDFKNCKTELVNPKEMDACRDKLRFVDVSYMPKRKGQTMMRHKDRHKGKTINVDTLQLHGLPQTVKHQIKSSQKQSRFGRQMLVSEARREFVWGSGTDKSRIKHQPLKDLQYRFKNQYKA